MPRMPASEFLYQDTIPGMPTLRSLTKLNPDVHARYIFLYLRQQSQDIRMGYPRTIVVMETPNYVFFNGETVTYELFNGSMTGASQLIERLRIHPDGTCVPYMTIDEILQVVHNRRERETANMLDDQAADAIQGIQGAVQIGAITSHQAMEQARGIFEDAFNAPAHLTQVVGGIAGGSGGVRETGSVSGGTGGGGLAYPPGHFSRVHESPTRYDTVGRLFNQTVNSEIVRVRGEGPISLNDNVYWWGEGVVARMNGNFHTCAGRVVGIEAGSSTIPRIIEVALNKVSALVPTPHPTSPLRREPDLHQAPPNALFNIMRRQAQAEEAASLARLRAIEDERNNAALRTMRAKPVEKQELVSARPSHSRIIDL